jgi:uncharacterized damage-inducible protein DinB
MQTQNFRGEIDEARLARAWTEWNLKSLSDYLAAILKLSIEERTKDRGASWGSIQGIFLHIVEDYTWWFECVPQGKGEEAFVELVGKDLSNSEIKDIVARVDRSVHSIIDSVTTQDLAHEYFVQATSGDGKPYKMTTTLADIIWHMLEEQLQHIGEINALFWQINVNPPTHAWFSSGLSYTR